MSFSINTNVGAMTANYNSNLKNNALHNSLDALSSGSKLTKSANDAASLSISDKLLAQISGQGQAIMNSNDSIGMMQIADGGLQGIGDNIDRIRVLTLQASNGTMNADNRATIQKEIDGLLESSDDIAKQTSYNGIKLLDGTGGDGNGTFTTQSGADAGNSLSVTIGNSDIASLLGSVDVTTQSGRDSALDSIDGALKSIGDTRATLGASQNQLMSNIRNTSLSQINEASAQSQMEDVDFAQESANFSSANLMSQIGSFAQSQVNASASANMARLLG